MASASFLWGIVAKLVLCFMKSLTGLKKGAMKVRRENVRERTENESVRKDAGYEYRALGRGQHQKIRRV